MNFTAINAVNELITVDNILFASTDAIPEIPAIPFVHPEAEKLIISVSSGFVQLGSPSCAKVKGLLTVLPTVRVVSGFK